MAKAIQPFPFEPLGDRVVVEPVPAKEEISESGIIIPVTKDADYPLRGVVIVVGPGKFENGDVVPMSVKTGQSVLFSKSYEDKKLRISHKDYYLISQSSVLGVIND